jgi:predicted nuclease of predicted toxin-antitoxin system
MRLLFDQNLSFRLVAQLSVDYPGCEHVRSAGFAAANDQDVWEYAAQNGFLIVSKDADFQHRALLYGPPPKVILLRIGNGPTKDIVGLLRSRQSEVLAFAADPNTALLVMP